MKKTYKINDLKKINLNMSGPDKDGNVTYDMVISFSRHTDKKERVDLRKLLDSFDKK